MFMNDKNVQKIPLTTSHIVHIENYDLKKLSPEINIKKSLKN